MHDGPLSQFCPGGEEALAVDVGGGVMLEVEVLLDELEVNPWYISPNELARSLALSLIPTSTTTGMSVGIVAVSPSATSRSPFTDASPMLASVGFGSFSK
jgi:hypothetical protein